MGHMHRPDVQLREHEWRVHVYGSETQPACPICRPAASIRQCCSTGRALFDGWVRAAQRAYQETRSGA